MVKSGLVQDYIDFLPYILPIDIIMYLTYTGIDTIPLVEWWLGG